MKNDVRCHGNEGELDLSDEGAPRKQKGANTSACFALDRCIHLIPII